MKNKFKVGDMVKVTGPQASKRLGVVFKVTSVHDSGSNGIAPYVRGDGEFSSGIFQRYLELATLRTDPTEPFYGTAGSVERNHGVTHYGMPEEELSGVYFHGAKLREVTPTAAREYAENILRIVKDIENDLAIRAAMTPEETEDERKKRELSEQIEKLQSELETLKGQAKEL